MSRKSPPPLRDPSRTDATQHANREQVPDLEGEATYEHPAHALQKAGSAQRTLAAQDVLQLQRTIGNQAVLRLMGGAAPLPLADSPRVNRTGLPDNLKAGIEAQSGLAMDDVRVHYNSPEPGRLNALAYTRGTEIHVGPGQEKHLPHEAWHVVQQKQGRVKPTMQLKGLHASDDRLLEHEADVMGAKALLEHTPHDAPDTLHPGGLSSGVSLVGGQVVQFEVDHNELYKAGLYVHNEMSSYRRFIGKSKKDWMGKEQKAFQWNMLVEDLLEGIDEGIDLATPITDGTEASVMQETLTKLEEFKKRLIEKKKKLEDLSAVLLKQVEDEKKFSDMKKTLEKFWTCHQGLIEIDEAVAELLPAHSSGGYSAQGRAHVMGISREPTDGFVREDTWFSDIVIGEAVISAYVYKEKKVVHDSASRPIVPRKGEGTSHDMQTLEKVIDKPPDKKQTGRFLKTPNRRDRGMGQFAAMKNTNASGYAMLAEKYVPNWKNQRWEWLHIRAASLDGATDGSNLVLGTRDVNTQMMPFEKNIHNLGTFVGENRDRYEELVVNFEIQDEQFSGSAKHLWSKISIDWRLVKKKEAEARETSGRAIFKPLTTDANISKAEVEILEVLLQEERDSLSRPAPAADGMMAAGGTAAAADLVEGNSQLASNGSRDQMGGLVDTPLLHVDSGSVGASKGNSSQAGGCAVSRKRWRAKEAKNVASLSVEPPSRRGKRSREDDDNDDEEELSPKPKKQAQPKDMVHDGSGMAVDS